jgi:hypothetical protein
MQNMAAQYSNTFSDIGREVSSWRPGGYRHESKTLSDAYEKNMYGLQMQGYKDAMDSMNDPLNTTFDYLTGSLGGAYQGASFGMQLDNLHDQSQAKKALEGILYGSGTALNAAGSIDAGSKSQNTAALYNQQYYSRLPGMPQAAAPSMPPPAVFTSAPSIAGPVKNNRGVYEAATDWVDSMGLAVDKNNWVYNPKTGSYQIPGFGYIAGPGAVYK